MIEATLPRIWIPDRRIVVPTPEEERRARARREWLKGLKTWRGRLPTVHEMSNWISHGFWTPDAAAPPAVSITDNFAGDGDLNGRGTTTGGATWVVLSGTWATSGGYATKTASNSTIEVAELESGTANIDYSLDVLQMGSSSGLSVIYLAFRITDANNFWVFQIFNGLLGTGIFKVVAGSKDSVGVITRSLTGPTIRLVANGDTLNAYDNGVNIFTRTDSFNNTATKHGFAAYNTDTHYDNLSITGL